MTLLNRTWRWLVCFVVGMLTTMLLAAFSDPAPALTTPDAFPEAQPSLRSTFSEVAASHLEPNLYQ